MRGIECYAAERDGVIALETVRSSAEEAKNAALRLFRPAPPTWKALRASGCRVVRVSVAYLGTAGDGPWPRGRGPARPAEAGARDSFAEEIAPAAPAHPAFARGLSE
jgi:hypothetical protein